MPPCQTRARRGAGLPRARGIHVEVLVCSDLETV